MIPETEKKLESLRNDLLIVSVEKSAMDEQQKQPEQTTVENLQITEPGEVVADQNEKSALQEEPEQQISEKIADKQQFTIRARTGDELKNEDGTEKEGTCLLYTSDAADE